MRRLCLVSLSCLCAMGCSGGLELAVDVRTDYRPAVEFTEVRVRWEGENGIVLGTESLSTGSFAASGQDFGDGVRIVDIRELPAGRLTVFASLENTSETVATRAVELELTADRALTVVITRENPPTSCTTDMDCPLPSVSCLGAECALGQCLELADDSRCVRGALCDPRVGCVVDALDGGTDAGTDAGPDASPRLDAGPGLDAGPDSCVATETRCTDGLDDDCDGQTDCADTDCGGVGCNDSNQCTHTDVCRAATGVCRGTTIACTNTACTTRSCNGTSSCTSTPRADGTGCPDEGNPCTQDRCSGGSCSHPALPNGTDLGGFNLCCSGTSVNVSTDENNCGACGLACSGVYDCILHTGQPTCDCGAANVECHGGIGFVCSTTWGVCACTSGCPTGASCVMRGGPDYCEY